MKTTVTSFISIIITITLAQSLHCMEIWHNPSTKDDMHLALVQRYFSHDTICALALVNKQWNIFIQQTAEQRKTFIEKQPEYHQTHTGYTYGTHHPTIWHPYRSAYTRCLEGNKDCSHDKINIIIYLVYLDGNNKIRVSTQHGPCYSIYCNFKPPAVLHEPFFTHKGDVSFYTYESSHGFLFYYHMTPCVVEYVLSTHIKPKQFECHVDVTHKDNIDVKVRLDIKNLIALFKNYPILCNAFMRSQRILLSDTWNNRAKIYDSDGVELDEDYLLHGTFPQLNKPLDVQNALISRCIIKNPKLFLLLCAQQDTTNIVSLLSQKIIRLIGAHMINQKNKG
jgi:hypothetical protein